MRLWWQLTPCVSSVTRRPAFPCVSGRSSIFHGILLLLLGNSKLWGEASVSVSVQPLLTFTGDSHVSRFQLVSVCWPRLRCPCPPGEDDLNRSDWKPFGASQGPRPWWSQLRDIGERDAARRDQRSEQIWQRLDLAPLLRPGRPLWTSSPDFSDLHIPYLENRSDRSFPPSRLRGLPRYLQKVHLAHTECPVSVSFLLL